MFGSSMLLQSVFCGTYAVNTAERMGETAGLQETALQGNIHYFNIRIAEHIAGIIHLNVADKVLRRHACQSVQPT